MSFDSASPFELGARAAEATIESASAWFGGLQAFGSASADYARAVSAAAGAAMEQIAAAEPGEAATTQADYLKDSWSGLVEQATTLNAIAADTGRDMMRPFEALASLRR
jgi:hypothetical protein